MNNPTECQNEKYLLWVRIDYLIDVTQEGPVSKSEYRLFEYSHPLKLGGIRRTVAIFKEKTPNTYELR